VLQAPAVSSKCGQRHVESRQRRFNTDTVCFVCLQQKVKKGMYAPVLAASWIVIPAFLLTLTCLSTDIIGGVCVPHGVYSSVAMANTISFAIFFVAYILPLTLMIFCYSRIVYALRFKVTTIHRESKKQDTKLLPITSPNVNRFSKFFH